MHGLHPRTGPFATQAVATLENTRLLEDYLATTGVSKKSAMEFAEFLRVVSTTINTDNLLWFESPPNVEQALTVVQLTVVTKFPRWARPDIPPNVRAMSFIFDYAAKARSLFHVMASGSDIDGDLVYDRNIRVDRLGAFVRAECDLTLYILDDRVSCVDIDELLDEFKRQLRSMK